MPASRIAKTYIYLFTVLLAAAVAAPAAWAEGDGPEFHSNALKYRESEHAKPARGRSGTAELYLRALLSKEDAAGTKATDIETRTNDFENPTLPPGKITKILLKAFNGEGGLKFTKNYNNLGFDGGSFTTTFTNLERGEKVEVQGSIRDIDRKRTDLVTLDTTVKFRPDLAITEIGAPAQAYVGTAVNISGTVVEKNGDVGARADCLLLVDNNKVDSADDIWIDAGGNVSCAFTHTFEKVGTYTLKVSADEVYPGDYDAENNSASATIQIIEPEPIVDRPFYFFAYVSDSDYQSKGASSGSYQTKVTGTYSYAYGAEYGSNYSSKGWTQYLGFYGWTPDNWTFPIQNVSASLTLDGKTLSTAAYTSLPADYNFRYTFSSGSWAWSSNSTCARRWKDSIWLFLCSYEYSWKWNAGGSSSSKGSYISYGRYAGEVTYHSDGWVRYWYQFNQTQYTGYYTWNYDFKWAYGPSRLALTPTSVVGFDVTVIDDDRRYHGAPSIASLRPFEWSYSIPSSCYSYNYDYDYSFTGLSFPFSYSSVGSTDGYACYQWSYWSKGFFGFAFGRSGPVK